MTARKIATTEAERAEARHTLRDIFPAGSDVTTLVTGVTRSGMSRTIRVLAPVRDRHAPGGLAVRDLSTLVARVLDMPYNPDGGVRVDGAGMDMCFHLVYSLARALYGNDKRGEMTARDKARLTRWRGASSTLVSSDVGYALSSRSL